MFENEEIINYLVTNRIYPMFSKDGKIFFLKRKNIVLSEQKKNEIIEKLNLRSKEDCKKIREIVGERLKKRRKHQPIKKWILEERPREMLVKFGAEKISMSKLLAIILRTGSEGISAEELARRLLNQFKTLRGIDSATISELCSVEGIGLAKATQIKAAFELGKRLYRERAEKKRRICSVEDALLYVSDFYAPYLRDSNNEFFNVILLDSRNKVIRNIEISKGSSTASVVEPKEIIMQATKHNAYSLILVHNHPSGEATPSREDIETTNKIISACNLVGIKVLDHIIIGKNMEEHVSFLERGLMK